MLGYILIFTTLQSHYGAVSTVSHKQTAAQRGTSVGQAAMCYLFLLNWLQRKNIPEHWNQTGVCVRELTRWQRKAWKHLWCQRLFLPGRGELTFLLSGASARVCFLWNDCVLIHFYLMAHSYDDHQSGLRIWGGPVSGCVRQNIPNLMCANKHNHHNLLILNAASSLPE